VVGRRPTNRRPILHPTGRAAAASPRRSLRWTHP
jgi:hypothetical protein